jgi:hypothetical protein
MVHLVASTAQRSWGIVQPWLRQDLRIRNALPSCLV